MKWYKRLWYQLNGRIKMRYVITIYNVFYPDQKGENNRNASDFQSVLIVNSWEECAAQLEYILEYSPGFMTKPIFDIFMKSKYKGRSETFYVGLRGDTITRMFVSYTEIVK